jgi:hypothetical protein
MTVAWLGGVYGIKSADACELPDRLRNLKLKCFSLDFSPDRHLGNWRLGRRYLMLRLSTKEIASVRCP